MTETIPCPVCGKTHVAEYDICDVCGWENDPVQLFEPNLPGGANEMSLQQGNKSKCDITLSKTELLCAQAI